MLPRVSSADYRTLADLSLLILVLGNAKFRGSLQAGSGSYDVMVEFSKWLEAGGEESIFSLEAEKNLPSASYEPPKPWPEVKTSQK